MKYIGIMYCIVPDEINESSFASDFVLDSVGKVDGILAFFAPHGRHVVDVAHNGP